VVAKVGNYYLYEEDIQKLLPQEHTLEDSLREAASPRSHRSEAARTDA